LRFCNQKGYPKKSRTFLVSSQTSRFFVSSSWSKSAVFRRNSAKSFGERELFFYNTPRASVFSDKYIIDLPPTFHSLAPPHAFGGDDDDSLLMAIMIDDGMQRERDQTSRATTTATRQIKRHALCSEPQEMGQ
jgi:hypothetical protein